MSRAAAQVDTVKVPWPVLRVIQASSRSRSAICLAVSAPSTTAKFMVVMLLASVTAAMRGDCCAFCW